MGKVRSISKFLCKERIVEHRYHGAHLPNYAIRASRRRKEKRGEAKKKRRVPRSNSARKHRRNHLRPPCLFNSCGPAGVDLFALVIRNFNRASLHTNTFTHGLASFDNPFISTLLVSSRPLPPFFPPAREISPRQRALLKCRETVSGGRPRDWLCSFEHGLSFLFFCSSTRFWSTCEFSFGPPLPEKFAAATMRLQTRLARDELLFLFLFFERERESRSCVLLLALLKRGDFKLNSNARLTRVSPWSTSSFVLY